MSDNVIELHHVVKIYNAALEKKPVTAVQGLSFSVQSGGITGFAGPNGAGKTTSIKMILGLIKPTSGDVKLMGEPAGTPQSREKISYISEQPYFYAHLSAEETLKFVCEMKHIPKAKRAKEINRVLKKVELDHRRSAKVKTFSKGMQQRLNMAQALLGNPELIIMDEPMSGLDPLGRRLFRSIFRDLADQGVTIFFSTHIIEDIESLCDRVVVLSKGELKYQGTIEELIASSTRGTEYRFSSHQAASLPEFSHFEGHETTTAPDGSVTISVTSSSDEVNRFIAQNSTVPLAISPIRNSLEEVLYDKAEEE